jgi:hypothetical protein
MRTLQERYDFLVKRLKVSDIDYWEYDALLKMKPFCFCFDPRTLDSLSNIDDVIDLAIETEEWDAKYAVNK